MWAWGVMCFVAATPACSFPTPPLPIVLFRHGATTHSGLQVCGPWHPVGSDPTGQTLVQVTLQAVL